MLLVRIVTPFSVLVMQEKYKGFNSGQANVNQDPSPAKPEQPPLKPEPVPQPTPEPTIDPEQDPGKADPTRPDKSHPQKNDPTREDPNWTPPTSMVNFDFMD
ncbi:hypothetical protein SAMN06265350_101352 [Solitalea koreensis]|uniref:Uncharacterized protein n=2 Tax=Solitalea koreensis TaxID=543615 RepID=A0A521ARY1_9SPHI|nr:hypothetical protein SAMN06265350_101352 [Solitalea koreensis]